MGDNKQAICPRCGSDNAHELGTVFYIIAGFALPILTGIGVLILSPLLGFLFPVIILAAILGGVLIIGSPFLPAFYSCSNCNKHWKAEKDTGETQAP